jgi:hypothetical protein
VVELEQAQSTVVVCSVDGGESGGKCRVRVDDASLRLGPGIRGVHNGYVMFCRINSLGSQVLLLGSRWMWSLPGKEMDQVWPMTS